MGAVLGRRPVRPRCAYGAGGCAVQSRRGGVSARLFRLSFSGELGYEVAVPARFGHAMAQALMQAGASFGIVPYGTEALGVMRIEKGHIAGSELDGRTTAADLGLGWMMSRNKDYVGRVMAERPGLPAPERQTLVGLSPARGTDRLHAGAHLIASQWNELARIGFRIFSRHDDPDRPLHQLREARSRLRRLPRRIDHRS